MPRGAAVVYPKDAAQIVAMADIFPGAGVVEAGVGSGALTCSLLRAVGDARAGVVVRAPRGVRRRGASERRASSSAAPHPAWRLTVGDLAEALPDVEGARRPGRPRHAGAVGVPRRGRRRAASRAASCARTSPRRPSSRASSRRCACTAGSPSRTAWESLVRDWHVEGLAVRPGPPDDRPHRLPGHRAPDGRGRRAPPRGDAGRRQGRVRRGSRRGLARPEYAVAPESGPPVDARLPR